MCFAQVRPSPWRQAVDLGNMMLVLALRSDPQRVYQQALAYFAEAELAEAFAAIRGVASPAQLRAFIKRDPRDLPGQFRTLAPPRPPVALQRWNTRRVALVAAALAITAFAAYSTIRAFIPGPVALGTNPPSCGTGPAVILSAQAVPLAALLPCITAFPACLLPAQVAAGHAGGMDASRAAEDPGTAQAAERETLAAQERAADERQLRAEEREHLAEERERAADQREARADERERLADQRERAADQREAELDERERELVERSQHLSTAIDDLETRALEAIERSRALLARSGKRLDRREETMRRQQARRERQQAEIERASAETERDLATWLPDPAPAIERSKKLRQQTLTAIEAFAANEEQIARLHDELAASQPNHRDEYRRVAEQARGTARRAREILRSATADLQSDLTTARAACLRTRDVRDRLRDGAPVLAGQGQRESCRYAAAAACSLRAGGCCFPPVMIRTPVWS